MISFLTFLVMQLIYCLTSCDAPAQHYVSYYKFYFQLTFPGKDVKRYSWCTSRTVRLNNRKVLQRAKYFEHFLLFSK